MLEIKGRFIKGRYIYGKPISVENSTPETPSLTKKGTYRKDTFSTKFYDNENIKVAEIQSNVANNKVVSLTFEENETGCGEMTFVTSEILSYIENLQRVDIHLFGDEIPWWSGYILTLPQSGGTDTKFTYKAHGYYNVLEKIMLYETYESKSVSFIVQDIARKLEENYNIVYNSSKLESVTYTVTKLKFDGVTVKDALQDLADFAVDFVFGVDYNRNLYFRSRETDVNEEARLWIGKHISSFEASENVDDIVNSAKVKNSNTTSTSTWITEVEDTTSQATYGLCQETWSLPSSYDEADANAWATNKMLESAVPVRSATVKNIKLEYKNADGSFNARKMSTIGQAAIHKLDNTTETYPISKLKYTISASKGIELTTMTLGTKEFTLSNYLANIERNIKVNEWLADANN